MRRLDPTHLTAGLLALLVTTSGAWGQDRELFRRGDANTDAAVDIADATSLLGCLFTGGSCPTCPDAADSNDDGALDLSDAVRVLSWLFLGAPEPPAPGPIECGVDPTEDRLGACEYPVTTCSPIEEDDPVRADVLSRLHYASIALPDGTGDPTEDQHEPVVGVFRPREVPYDPRPGRDSRPWNSAEGRLQLEGMLDFEHDREGAAHHAHGSVEQQILANATGPVCIEPRYWVSASDRQFEGWPGIKFQAPRNAFNSSGEARLFLEKVQAEQPFFLPYTNPNVVLRGGWYYNTGGLHRACDYSRDDVETNEDPTFEVRSCSDGRVVQITWDDNGGNLVAVESTAPGGQKVMFIYLHLRNGRTNDLASAAAVSTSSTNESTQDDYQMYRDFAANYPNHISWGDDDDTIQVVENQDVVAGQLLGYAGNTGVGGAKAGLSAGGVPDNWKGNTHLHLYVAVPHPTDSNTWVWVDPYGVYDQADTGCYDLLKDTRFSRLFAPFMPSFHGVPYEVLAYYAGYYPNMGFSLRTLSVHRQGNRLLASGAFQSIPGAWRAVGYLPPQTFQAVSEESLESSLIAREVSIAKTGGGSPRYTAIFRRLENGEQFEHRAAMTTNELYGLWESRVENQGWHLQDYFGYEVSGTDRHSALFSTEPGGPFAFSGPVSANALDQMVDDMRDQGLFPVNFNVAWMNGTRYYSAVFRPDPGCWRLYFGMSPGQYQSMVADHLTSGWRIHKVQGYADSDRFGVIFWKPGCN